MAGGSLNLTLRKSESVLMEHLVLARASTIFKFSYLFNELPKKECQGKSNGRFAIVHDRMSYNFCGRNSHLFEQIRTGLSAFRESMFLATEFTAFQIPIVGSRD